MSAKNFLGILYGFSLFYRCGVKLRNTAYNKKWIKSVKARAPVVSVGNIVAGGSGKTPLVRLIAEELKNSGKVAILSRGYKSQIEKRDQVVEISTGEGPLFSPEVCGDEPYFLASRLRDVSIWVGKKRTASAREAVAKKADLLLLDDGMQHRRLKRDFEIVVMDGQDLFGDGHFLPRGMLRDSPKRLKEADLVFVNHVRDLKHFREIEEKLEAWTKAPLVGAHFRLDADLAGKKVALFCGIAKPQRFIDSVRELGAEVVDTMVLGDHEAPKESRLSAFAEACAAKGAECIVCTEKDAVKLSQELKLALPILPIEGKLEITRGKTNWAKLIQKIKAKI